MAQAMGEGGNFSKELTHGCAVARFCRRCRGWGGEVGGVHEIAQNAGGKNFKKIAIQGLPVPTCRVYNISHVGGAARGAKEGMLFYNSVVTEEK